MTRAAWPMTQKLSVLPTPIWPEWSITHLWPGNVLDQRFWLTQHHGTRYAINCWIPRGSANMFQGELLRLSDDLEHYFKLELKFFETRLQLDAYLGHLKAELPSILMEALL